MTTFTTNFAWPVPSGTDQPDGAAQFSALATPIDATVFAGIPYVARQTLGGSAASVTFSSIPSALRRLRITWTARGDNAVQVSFMRLRVNGDSGANYNSSLVQNHNTTISGSSSAAVTFLTVGVIAAASATAGSYGSGTVDIAGWDSPHSIYLGTTHSSMALGSTTADFWAETGGGAYAVAGPYTSVTLFPDVGNFVIGSDFQIEGVRT